MCVKESGGGEEWHGTRRDLVRGRTCTYGTHVKSRVSCDSRKIANVAAFACTILHKYSRYKEILPAES